MCAYYMKQLYSLRRRSKLRTTSICSELTVGN